jgi:hypothetical protein
MRLHRRARPARAEARAANRLAPFPEAVRKFGSPMVAWQRTEIVRVGVAGRNEAVTKLLAEPDQTPPLDSGPLIHGPHNSAG